MSTLTIIRQRRHRRSQIHSSARQRSLRTAFVLGFVFSAALVLLILGAVLAYAALTRGLPSVDGLSILLNPDDGRLLQPTRLYDRTGQHLLAVLSPADVTRVYALYTQLPPTLINATIALFEPGFWSSPGFSFSGWQDPQSHPTLAQQLVSDLLLADQPRSPQRAIHERMLAAQVTSRFGRQKVLEWYLNSADFGHYAYGAEAAAQLYLGKSVTQINLGEAALLAAIARAPAINPIDAPRAAEENRLQALQTMLEQGLITPDEAALAAGQTPSVPPAVGGETGAEGTLAPAFVNLILSQLDAQFGAGRVERGGLTITTTLDYDLQQQAVCVAQAQVNRLSGSTVAVTLPDGSPCTAASLLPALPSAENLPGASVSILMTDPQTGQILADVGDTDVSGQAGSLASHPAGTSITPFIYLTAFSRGLNPATLGWDIPGGSPLPGQVYHGPVSLRTALANDYLPPALNLIDQMSAESIRNIAAPFGLTLPSNVQLLQEDFPVSPITLAEAYGVFATGGTLEGQSFSNSGLHSVTVLQVSSLDHAVWADWKSSQARLLLSQPLAWLMNQVLSDETARWPSLGHPNPLEIGRPAGARIAHSLDFSAYWVVGYTPQRLTVVWLGRASQSPKVQAEPTGPLPSHLSADLWHALMQVAVRDLPPAGWDMPPGITTVPVCDPSGLLPTAACPNVVNEFFLEGRQPVQMDTLYQVFQVNAETGLLATVFTPPELVENRTFLVVPPEARSWARSAGIPTPPASYDTLRQPKVLPDAHITTPAMFSSGRLTLEIRGSASGADFVSYRLEYGQGLYPRGWVLIGTDSTTPVTEGLLGSWDTSGLNGLYALRLMVVRRDQRVDQAVVQVTLDNTPPQVAITYPQAGQTINALSEPQVALQAQAGDPFLEKVEFYVDGILVGQSSVAPFGVLWPAKAGEHTLRVVASDQAGNTAEARIIFTVGK